jgi:hypothetical protein
MRVRSAMAGATAAMLVALSGALLAPAPAQAASRYVGTNAVESRCQYLYKVCLYFSTWTSAYWAANGSDSTLQGDRYRSGTGSGSGDPVRNNSRKIYCDYFVANVCDSYVYPGHTGNDDYLYYEQRGELFHTWNNNASVRLT